MNRLSSFAVHTSLSSIVGAIGVLGIILLVAMVVGFLWGDTYGMYNKQSDISLKHKGRNPDGTKKDEG